MKIQTIIMPAYWASALVNLDYSGLDDVEIYQLKEYLHDNDLSIGDCLMCSEFEQINTFNGKLCMTLEYSFEA